LEPSPLSCCSCTSPAEAPATARASHVPQASPGSLHAVRECCLHHHAPPEAGGDGTRGQGTHQHRDLGLLAGRRLLSVGCRRSLRCLLLRVRAVLPFLVLLLFVLCKAEHPRLLRATQDHADNYKPKNRVGGISTKAGVPPQILHTGEPTSPTKARD
jgi:hypothetical protein